ncbi:DUF2075 domain-containing protein [Sphingomonas sp. BN140010]|uniref:DUF2075 domain-containing protein n=1 Tax=Sphingomonas arvum TaxID=2992113 RepID=A0ABT3JE99_9SPHN|nr:DUF2075 domain-containing protein [Sphingomonas sp. BN140010]MCW3797403.1 DUF2075 domain-containing protein [Sphingomonas sp. BN140010]
MADVGRSRLQRAYFDADAATFYSANPNEILGALTSHLPFALEPAQRGAWLYQIQHLKQTAAKLPEAHMFLEFMIPRMGRRADALVVYRGVIFVLEYKVGAASFDKHAINQTVGYALDLKHFHETSHELPIVPILIATEAVLDSSGRPEWGFDGLAELVQTNGADLDEIMQVWSTAAPTGGAGVHREPLRWAAGRYKPTPTIIEAAQALYRGHDVHEISRSEAGADNLSTTASFISSAIANAKQTGDKIICFVTGVPGSGKTLAGLNIANERMKADEEEHAVFLSGNGPLVQVLRKALADDAVHQLRKTGIRASVVAEARKADAFIQNIHHFRDEALSSSDPPVGKVVVFDEAQRAWDLQQTSRFMREKRGQHDFSMSEPEFLLSVMDRHEGWCAVVCLIGGGQEINTGEAGLTEWTSALSRAFPTWKVYISDRADLTGALLDGAEHHRSLHLATSIRSFRAERLSEFVAALIDGRADDARNIKGTLTSYPMAITRSLTAARHWLRKHRRANERMGLLASSNALRLKPDGIFVKAKVDPPLWFLAPGQDVRSSDSLEDAATEFEVQGLELDWAGVCWDLNFRWTSEGWAAQRFRGSRWEKVSDPQRRAYVANSYRVLLTRARQGLIIFVPQGDICDATRPSSLYDATYDYLRECGIKEVNDDWARQPT